MKIHYFMPYIDEEWEDIEEALTESEIDYAIKNDDYGLNTIIVDINDAALTESVLDDLNIKWQRME